MKLRVFNIVWLVFVTLNVFGYNKEFPLSNIDSISFLLNKLALSNRNYELNKEFDKTNYILYYNPYTNSTTPPTENISSPPPTSDWIKEEPGGILPLIDYYRPWLVTYNNKIHPQHESEVQHYVVIIDLYKAVDINMSQTLAWNSMREFYTPDTNALNRQTYFNQIVKNKIEDFKNNFKFSEVFTPGAKIYISLCLIDRNVRNTKIETTIKIQGLVRNVGDDLFKNKSEKKNVDGFYDFLNKEYTPDQRKGLNYIASSIRAFIEYFWEGNVDYPYFPSCAEYITSQNYNSNIAGQFITDNCGNISDTSLHLTAIYLKSSEFLDWVAVNSAHFSPSWWLTNKYDPDKWKTDLEELINDYKLSPLPHSIELYKVWLKNRYANEDDLDRILLAYLNDFYNYGEYTFTQTKNILIADWVMTQCNNTYIGTVPAEARELFNAGNPRYGWKLNEDFYSDFYKIFTDLNSGAFTQSEKDEIYNLIMGFNSNYSFCNGTSIEEIFWKYYLNPWQLGVPLVGQSGMSMAQAVAEFIRSQKVGQGPIYNFPNIDDPANYIVYDFTKNASNSKGLNGLDIIKSRQATFDATSKKLNFIFQLCGAYIPPSTTWTPYGTYSNPASCTTDNAPLEKLNVNFWDVFYVVKVDRPGYFLDCVANEEYRQLIDLEPAFFTAYKVRENNAQETMTQVSLAVEILTLPLYFVGGGEAIAAMRIIHGIWVANSIVTIGILSSGGGEEFKAKCQEMMGPSRGATFADYVITINTVVALSQLTQPTTALLKRISTTAANQAVAANKWIQIYRVLRNSDVPHLDNAALNTIAHQIYNDAKVMSSSCAPPAKSYDEIFEIDILGLNRRFNNQKLNEVVVFAQSKNQSSISTLLNNLDNIPNGSGKTLLDDFVEDISNSGSPIKDFINGSTSELNLANRLNAWKLLNQSSIKSLSWLTKFSVWLEAGMAIEKNSNINGAYFSLKNGLDEFGRIRNGQALSTSPTNSGTVFDNLAGYKIYKNGSSFTMGRDFDLSSFSPQYRNYLTGGPDAHCPHRHLTDLNDEQLAFRSSEAYAPDGTTTYNSSGQILYPTSSKFGSNQDLINLIDNTKPGYGADPPSAWFAAKFTDPNSLKIFGIYDFGSSNTIGYGITFGGNGFRPPLNPREVLAGPANNVTFTKAYIEWKRISVNDDWYILTAYPRN